jgi:hypothetical protein
VFSEKSRDRPACAGVDSGFATVFHAVAAPGSGVRQAVAEGDGADLSAASDPDRAERSATATLTPLLAVLITCSGSGSDRPCPSSTRRRHSHVSRLNAQVEQSGRLNTAASPSVAILTNSQLTAGELRPAVVHAVPNTASGRSRIPPPSSASARPSTISSGSFRVEPPCCHEPPHTALRSCLHMDLWASCAPKRERWQSTFFSIWGFLLPDSPFSRSR